MKKRSKIIALVITLCLCLSMFTIGVLAATSASLSVTSSLNFTADGVYVMVDASLKQGADVENATVLSGEGGPTGQTTFKAYSYPRASGQDYPSGEPSTTYFVNERGAQVSAWAIGDITYTSTNTVVVYEFLVSNYSNFEVQGMVEGISDILDVYVTSGQISIVTYTGTSSESADATDPPTYTFNIPARINETTPGIVCYKIVVALNDFMNTLTTGEIEMNVSFKEKELEPVYEYFQYSGTSITGLSDVYKNLEIKPETLIVPSKDNNGNNITTIPDSSIIFPPFYGLESDIVIIQEGITSIGINAFYACDSLTRIEIPSSVTNIGYGAFSDCSLLKIMVANDNANYSSDNGSLYNKNKTELVRGAGGVSTFNVLDTVTSIAKSAFNGCDSLTSIEIPNSVTSIGYGAFYGCDSLTSIEIPNSVTSIEGDAFSYSSIKSVTFETGCKLTTIEDIFTSCDLTSVEIPNSVTSIGGHAFWGCDLLTSVTFETGSKLISIGSSAFGVCHSLISIEIPSSVTSIGSYAFSDCPLLSSIEIPSSVTSIGSYAFSDCDLLTRLTINTKPGYVWQKASNNSFTSNLLIVDVSDPNQNATWFKDTSGYQNYYWRQIEESLA